MELDKSFAIAFAGLNAEEARLKVIAENIANADSTAQTPGGEPYRRKLISFKDVFDKSSGVDTVQVSRVTTSSEPFGRRYEPGHPAADADGYVQTPNVNSLSEMNDMREAERAYEANLNVIDAAKSILTQTFQLLHG